MPVEHREPIIDFTPGETVVITARYKDWYVLKESFVFNYNMKQLVEPNKLVDLAFRVVAGQYNAALATGSVPSLGDMTQEPDKDDTIVVSLPNMLFLAVFAGLDKVAYYAETEATPEKVIEVDPLKALSLLDGAQHVLDAYHVFQPQAAAITATYATA